MFIVVSLHSSHTTLVPVAAQQLSTTSVAPPTTTTRPVPADNRIVDVHIDLVLTYADQDLLAGTSQEVWSFFKIFCDTFTEPRVRATADAAISTPARGFSCRAVGSTADIVYRKYLPTVLKPLVAARRFLGGQFVLPFHNRTYLMSLRFYGALDTVQGILDVLRNGSHAAALGIQMAYPMPDMSEIYSSPAGDGGGLRIGTFDTQLSITWHVIISVGTILVAASLYIIRVRAHPGDSNVTSQSRDGATGGDKNVDDLENPNEHQRWLPTATDAHREILLSRAEQADVLAAEISESAGYGSKQRGAALINGLPIGSRVIGEEMKRQVEFIDGALELAPQLQVPPDTSAPGYKKPRWQSKGRRRFLVTARERGGDGGENDGDGAAGGIEMGGKSAADGLPLLPTPGGKAADESQIELKAVRSGMTALAEGIVDTERAALGLARRRVAASMTTYAMAHGEGRTNHRYKETEISMIATSPLTQRRERRAHQPELSWAELRRLQEEYEAEVLADIAKRAGMKPPSEAAMAAHAASRRAPSAEADYELDVREVDDDDDQNNDNGDDDDFAHLHDDSESPARDDRIDPREI